MMEKWYGMVPVLDNGHGGVIGGEYQTPGKRSPDELGMVMYEGMFNRWVVNRVIEEIGRLGIPYYHASPELEDTSLEERVLRINRFHGKHGDRGVYLLSVHANAGGGEGMEVFTSKGQTLSDTLAEMLLDSMKGVMPDYKFREDRSDGDGDKEANFFLLRKTSCPAMLLEVAFMDTERDYARLWSEEFLDDVVRGIVLFIRNVYLGVR